MKISQPAWSKTTVSVQIFPISPQKADSIAVTDGRIEAFENGFVSRIYFYDGNVCEQYCEADMEFDAEYGDAITQAESLEASSDDKAYYINIGIDGTEYPLIFTKNK